MSVVSVWRASLIALIAITLLLPGSCKPSAQAVVKSTIPSVIKTTADATMPDVNLRDAFYPRNTATEIANTTTPVIPTGQGYIDLVVAFHPGDKVTETTNTTILAPPIKQVHVYLVAANDAPAGYQAKADLLGSTGAVIQKAIDGATSGTIELIGTFTITSNITLTKSDIHFVAAAGEGSATLNFTTSTFHVYGNQHSKLNDVSFEGIRWTGSGYPANLSGKPHNNSLLYVEFVDNLVISHNYADSTQGTPFFIGSIGGQGNVENKNVTFSHNYIANAPQSYGVIFNTVRGGLIEDNTVLNTGVNAIAASYWGSSRIRVLNNYVRNSGHGAIAMSPGIDSEVIGNTVEGPGGITEGGIEVQSKHAGSPFPGRGSSNVTVAGNIVRGFYWGIYVNGNNGPGDGGLQANNYNTKIYGNTIEGNMIGIYLDQYSVETDIRGNTLRGNETDISDNGTRTIFGSPEQELN